MYRIVLVDDEEHIRQLIAKKINRADKPFEVVGIAENGLEGIELVKELQPDILITDICMPLMDGLELIRQVNALNTRIKTLVISGYDDFAYAKKAVTLGVKEYLLKPFRAVELFEVLERVQGEIDEELAFIRNIEYMSHELERTNHQEKQVYLQKVIQGSMDNETMLREAGRLKIAMTAKWYTIGIIRFWDTEGNVILDEDQKQLDTFIELVNANYFPDIMTNHMIVSEHHQLIILMCGNQKSAPAFYQDIEEGLQKINQSMETYYDMKFNCILGKGGIKLEQVQQSYQQALLAWRSVLWETACVMRYEQYESCIGLEKNLPLQRPIELENNLLLNIQKCHYTEAIACLDNILAYYSPIYIMNAEFVSVAIIELVLGISEATGRAGGNLKAWEDEGVIRYLRRHFSSASLMEAKMVLQQYILKCCDQFALMGEKSGDKIVGNMKTLIDNKLSEELFTLDDIAEALHFSPNYLRQLFKQKTGESFKEYFIRKRMEKASQLITTTNMKVQDIANDVGYSDQRYFSRCFKKYFGCTASEFREENQLTNNV